MGDLALDFNRSEFACKCGCGFDTVDAELLDIVVDVRSHFGAAVTINSGCRCATYNTKIGGAKKSRHLTGDAADIVVDGVSASEVASYLERRYSTRYGIFRYHNFTHVDRRPNKARGDLTKGGTEK